MLQCCIKVSLHTVSVICRPYVGLACFSPHGKFKPMMYSSVYWINAGLPLEKLHDTAHTRSQPSPRRCDAARQQRAYRRTSIYALWKFSPPFDSSVTGRRFEMICRTNVIARLLIWMRDALKGSDLDVIASRSPAVALSFPSLRRTPRVHWFRTV